MPCPQIMNNLTQPPSPNMRIVNFVPVDNNATGAEFYTSEGDTPGNIVFNIVVNVQLRQSQNFKNTLLQY